MVNFTECANTYIGNETLISKWGWTGPVKDIDVNRSSQISEAGCYHVCGHGNDWYDWSAASSTITTWILPVIGVLLQAPFESNAFWRTMFAIARWVGSPMASLSCILWNIAVSGKCAMMVDMAVRYDDRSRFEDSDLGSIRDSLYILMNMNQYTIKPMASLTKEAEGLLRIVLFSKDLRLRGTDAKLKEVRGELACMLRERRRRGVVPVFISTGWFLFSLGISIQGAFGQLGQNAEAHDLALGLLLGWLPILIMCCIIDRNPVAAEDVRRRINEVIDTVAFSLKDEAIVAEFIATIHSPTKAEEMERRVQRISEYAENLAGNFFMGFGGQGRVRWHYGAAQPILSDIENCFVAERGRNWLCNEPEARTELVLGSVDRGLFFFDFRQLWQMVSSVIIVGGSALGAFILSYYTPTVGLGCRSLGYLIFCVISFFLLIFEFVVWWLSSPEREEERLRHRDPDMQPNRLRPSQTFQQLGAVSEGFLQRTKSTLCRLRDDCEDRLIDTLPPLLSYCYPRKKRSRKEFKIRERLKRKLRKYRDFSLREWTERLVFRPIEFFNMMWLTYISLAQTFGSYNNCRCQCSVYGRIGGYMDLNLVNQAPSAFVLRYWKTGTVLSCTIMGLSMVYVVLEWCLQSHLSTENPDNARKGLQRTRKFRRFISPLRSSFYVVYFAINKFFAILILPMQGRGGKRMQRSLVWSKDITYEYPPRPMSKSQRPRHPSSPSMQSIGSTPAEATMGTESPSHILYDAPLQRSDRRFRVSRDAEMDANGSSATRPLIIEPPLTAYAPSQRDGTPSTSSDNSDEVAEVGPLDAMPMSMASPPPMERLRRLTSHPTRQRSDGEDDGRGY